MRLSDALSDFRAAVTGVLSPRTVEWYAERLGSLLRYLGDEDIADIDTQDLRRWRAALLAQKLRWEHHPKRPTQNSGLSPYTVAGHVRACRRLFSWLYEEGQIDANPARRLEMPALPDREPKAITREDREAMIKAAEETGARATALILFLAETGARLSGVTGLTLGDLDLGKMQAMVYEKAIGRGGHGKARFVFFTERTAEALRRYLEIRPATDSDRVWIGRCGPLGKWGIYHVLRRLAEKARIEGRWNPHAFRHGWAKAALEAGADLGTVSQVLGHSDIVVTHRHYGRWTDGELGERARKFSPINNASPTDV